MPIKKIGINKYIWQKPPSLASLHEGALGAGARNPLQRWRKVPASGPSTITTSSVPEGLKNNVGGYRQHSNFCWCQCIPSSKKVRGKNLN